MLLLVLATAVFLILVQGQEGKWLSPVYENFYEFPLPIPPVKTPLKRFTFANGNAIDYYEIEIKPAEVQLYPGLNKTRLVAYDGVAPGPTFHMTRGIEAVVRFINLAADRANSVHLHGSYSRTPFDGWAEDITEVGEYKDYYYPNRQNARSLWYHDHAIDHTAENAYFGQAGFYIIHDDDELATQGLPQGAYDIPLALAARRYNFDGSLWSPEANLETVSLFGDVIHVNGQPWPFLAVEPRRYRFRLLNTSLSRTFELYFEDSAGRRFSFFVVAADTGLLSNPVATTELYMSMAERWEIVVDFTPFAGQNVTLRNSRDVGADEDYDSTDKVMRFVVGNTVTDQTKNEPLPATLRDVPFPTLKNGVDRSFKFERHQGKWAINDHFWSDGPEARVLAKPPRGQTEVWELENGGGGWSHPVHIHLIDFQILSRDGGPRGDVVLPYEKVALKDVVWLDTGETVRVIARYAPWDGLYMFHCHNLIHEDHEMMAAFNVTALEDLGYDEKTRFLDPMEQKYRALPFAPNDPVARQNDFSDAAIEAKMNSFNNLEAYIHVSETDEKLKSYWATHLTSNTGSSSSTGSTTSTSGLSTTGTPGSTTSSSTSVTSPTTSSSGGSSTTPSILTSSTTFVSTTSSSVLSSNTSTSSAASTTPSLSSTSSSTLESSASTPFVPSTTFTSASTSSSVLPGSTPTTIATSSSGVSSSSNSTSAVSSTISVISTTSPGPTSSISTTDVTSSNSFSTTSSSLTRDNTSSVPSSYITSIPGYPNSGHHLPWVWSSASTIAKDHGSAVVPDWPKPNHGEEPFKRNRPQYWRS